MYYVYSNKEVIKMRRAEQRCFELLALIGSPQLLLTKLFPSWTASGSSYDFPGVDHEGRQTCRLKKLLLTIVRIYSTIK